MASDWNNALRIGKIADEICEAVEHVVPHRRLQNLVLLDLYDLRGQVEELPALAVVCTTSTLRFGMARQPTASRFSHVILVPNFLLRALNKLLIQSQTLLHHEVAHILLGHEDGPDYSGQKSPAYFNHPAELDAYFHQGISALARSDGYLSWNKTDPQNILGDDPQKFATRFQLALKPKFWKALSQDNKYSLSERALTFWKDGKKHLEFSNLQQTSPLSQGRSGASQTNNPTHG